MDFQDIFVPRQENPHMKGFIIHHENSRM